MNLKPKVAPKPKLAPKPSRIQINEVTLLQNNENIADRLGLENNNSQHVSSTQSETQVHGAVASQTDGPTEEPPSNVSEHIDDSTGYDSDLYDNCEPGSENQTKAEREASMAERSSEESDDYDECAVKDPDSQADGDSVDSITYDDCTVQESKGKINNMGLECHSPQVIQEEASNASNWATFGYDFLPFVPQRSGPVQKPPFPSRVNLHQYNSAGGEIESSDEESYEEVNARRPDSTSSFDNAIYEDINS